MKIFANLTLNTNFCSCQFTCPVCFQFHVDSFQLKAVSGDRVTNQNKR